MDWQTGKVIKIIKETHNTNRYIIEAMQMSSFDFLPGQFITLDLPIHPKKNKRLRSYSIASAPDGSNQIELLISLVEDGLGTPYIFEQIKEGDELTFRGPHGVFTLPTNTNTDLFLICTGTGIAPFRSMINYIYQQQIGFPNVYIIFGTRTQNDLLYYNELRALESKMKNFHFIPVLSREQWEGKSGYVHPIYMELSHHNPNAQFMLCGWRNMVDEARANLDTAGFDKAQVHFELYG